MEFNDKQVQIIEEAEKLFAQKGFKGTSVREIAQNAGINLAMISYYFGSKDKLLEAIFVYRGHTTKISLEEILKNGKMSPAEKIDVLIEKYVQKIFSQKPFYKIMSKEMLTNNTENTEKLILEIKTQNLELIAKIISEGQKSGEFSTDVDLPLIMATLSGAANNFIATQKYYRKLSGLESMKEKEFENLLLNKLTKNLKRIFKTLLSNDN